MKCFLHCFSIFCATVLPKWSFILEPLRKAHMNSVIMSQYRVFPFLPMSIHFCRPSYVTFKNILFTNGQVINFG